MQVRILKDVYFVTIDGVTKKSSKFYPSVLELTKRNKKYYFFPEGFPSGMMLREKYDDEEVVFLEEAKLPTLQDLELQFDFYIAARDAGNEVDAKKRIKLIEMTCMKQYSKEFNYYQTTI